MKFSEKKYPFLGIFAVSQKPPPKPPPQKRGSFVRENSPFLTGRGAEGGVGKTLTPKKKKINESQISAKILIFTP